MKKIKIGLIGLGTVGTGVAKIIAEKKELLTSRLGACLDMVRVADLDIVTDRGLSFQDGVLTTDAFLALDDPDIDIIVEMIGGTGFAKEIVLRAIENGKHVVTANKALLADCGKELFEKAMEKKVDIAFEASVGGCMPIIKTLRESMIGNEIKGITGILNGTCNYILSKMYRDKTSFKDALKEAMDKGFAEADPTLDISGEDSAHKLAVLTSLAYGTDVNLADIYLEGIENIHRIDIAFAEEFGYRIKLIATNKPRGNAIEARVHPAMISNDNLLANVEENLNAVTVTGDSTGDILLYGYGAGMMPTASAVVGDIVDIARNIMSGAAGRIPLIFNSGKSKNIPIMPIDDIQTHYYIRFSAIDQPGVLSKISGALGKHQISIKTVHQKSRRINNKVPVVMLTHRARESNMKTALALIKQMNIIDPDPVLIRIEGEMDDDE